MIFRQKDDKAYRMSASAVSLAPGFNWHCPLAQSLRVFISHRHCEADRLYVLGISQHPKEATFKQKSEA